MRQYLSGVIIAVASMFMLIGCGESDAERMVRMQQQQQYQQQMQQPVSNGQGQYAQTQQGQPIIINQQPAQQSNGMGDMLLGAAAGYAISSALNSSNRQVQSTPNTVYVDRHIYHSERNRTSPVVNSAVSNVNKAEFKPPVAPIVAPKPTVTTPSITPRSNSFSSTMSRSTFSSSRGSRR